MSLEAISVTLGQIQAGATKHLSSGWLKGRKSKFIFQQEKIRALKGIIGYRIRLQLSCFAARYTKSRYQNDGHTAFEFPVKERWIRGVHFHITDSTRGISKSLYRRRSQKIDSCLPWSCPSLTIIKLTFVLCAFLWLAVASLDQKWQVLLHALCLLAEEIRLNL